MRREWVIALLVFAALGAFVLAGTYFRRTGGPEPVKPWPDKPAVRSEVQSRCESGRARELKLLVDGALVWARTNSDVVSPGEESESLLLSELLRNYPTKTTLLVVPCAGEARRFSAGELRQQPQRFAIFQNSKGLLKLVDETPPPNTPRLQMKNLYAVEILD